MNVRETVLDAMKTAGLGGYETQAGPIITALEQRESEAVGNLIDYAVDQGLGRDDARRAIANCGFEIGTTAPTEDPRVAAMEAQIIDMQATLRDLRGE